MTPTRTTFGGAAASAARRRAGIAAAARRPRQLSVVAAHSELPDSSIDRADTRAGLPATMASGGHVAGDDAAGADDGAARR